MSAADGAGVGSFRWEGDSERRPLGSMERLLCARRSWNSAMTTAHVSAALLQGPPPTEDELLAGLTWVLQRHPLLRACVRGKGKFAVRGATPYPLHSDYLGRAVAYNEELLRVYPDEDIQHFAPSPLSAEELGRRALRVERSGAWRRGFRREMDELLLDEEGDGPLWRLTLYADEGSAAESVLVYAANHAISDQLSFNLVLSQLLRACAESRAGRALPPPEPLPLPPSVEGALLGKEQRQAEDIKSRLELIIGRFGEPVGPTVPLPEMLGGPRKLLPSWEPGRARWASIKYALWQLGASGMKVLPRWVPRGEQITPELEPLYEHRGRRTGVALRTVDAADLSALRLACRSRGVTVCAAAALGASDAMGEPSRGRERYKLLQAVDMRPLGEHAADWAEGTVVAGTGSLDLLLDLPSAAGEAVRAGAIDQFWACASECHRQTREWIAAGWARESLLLFSCGWEFMNMNRVVELGSQDRTTLGRAYSAGISNVGVYSHDTKYGDLTLSELYFGISQTVSAPSISVSSVTVDGKLCVTVAYATPIWSEDDASSYADDLITTLRAAASAH